jgi:non-specific serine/threonine protein kinase
LAAEIDNLRAALAWCQEAADAHPGSECAAPTPRSGVPSPPAAEAGLRLADALYYLWIHCGYLTEGSQWLEGALVRGSEAPASLRAGAFLHAAWLAQYRGKPESHISFLRSARQGFEEALTLARTEGDRSGIAAAVLALAEVTQGLGDKDAAWSYGVEARRRKAELEEPVGLASALENMAAIALARKDHRNARALLDECVALRRERGDSSGLIHTLGAMGHLARDDGDYASARAIYRESLMLRRDLGHRIAVAQSLEDLAVLAGREKQAERAIRILGAAEVFCGTLGARSPVADPTEYERTVAEGRAALGEEAFAAAWAAGRALSLDQAVAEAFGGSDASSTETE